MYTILLQSIPNFYIIIIHTVHNTFIIKDVNLIWLNGNDYIYWFDPLLKIIIVKGIIILFINYISWRVIEY